MPQDEDDTILHQDEVEAVIDEQIEEALQEDLQTGAVIDELVFDEEDVPTIVAKVNEIIAVLRDATITTGSDD